MSRFTQYIGLTEKAREHVSMMKELSPNPEITTGIADEPVPGGKWKDENGTVWEEIVQAIPWSSGPMIFTCLVNDRGTKRYFEWTEADYNENNNQEYDQHKGIIYI